MCPFSLVLEDTVVRFESELLDTSESVIMQGNSSAENVSEASTSSDSDQSMSGDDLWFVNDL